jgi:hypothetical protein
MEPSRDRKDRSVMAITRTRKRHSYETREDAERALWAVAKYAGKKKEDFIIIKDQFGPGYIILRRRK